MNEASSYLLRLAKRVARPYGDLPGARAAMVTGSVAEDKSDFYSDVDMVFHGVNSNPMFTRRDGSTF